MTIRVETCAGWPIVLDPERDNVLREAQAVAASDDGYDPVTYPQHYVRLHPEPLDVIEAWGLEYHEASALKYIVRAGHKGSRIEDLEKAHNLLARKLKLLRGGG